MTDAIPHQHERSTGIGTGRLLAWVVLFSAMFFPRLVIVGFWIFSDLLGRAISSNVVCVLGFLLLPWTVLTYATVWSIGSDRVSGVEWIPVGIMFLVDAFTWLAGRSSLSFD